MGTFITTEHDGAVALVTIDNPPMNALSAALVEELEAEVDRLDGDAETRAIVLRGGGERAFVAGADIKEFPALREAGGNEGGAARGLHALGHRMDAAHKPFVAAIKGYCLGGGLELAMCCDVRICADDAQLGQPEIKLGLIPGGGGTQRLPRLVGVGRANLLNLGGEFIDAETAYAWGLVEKVVPADELISAAIAVAASFAARLAARGGGDPRSSRGRRATSRSRRGSAARPTASAAASLARTGRRASPRSSRSASRSSRAADAGGRARGDRRAGAARAARAAARRLPEDGQVVVEVKAVAINFLEILIRRGLYPQMPELPWIPGTEIAGVTDDGRRVIGLVRSSGGGYAELAAVDEQWLFDLPAGASFEEGAAFLMAYLTAWIPLTRQVVIHPGARVLVHAAAGGVGSAAVVVARDLGAEVVATAGSDDKLALPLSLGATQAVTYDQLDEIEPVDVVFDPVGGQLFADSIKLLRPLGAAIAIGFAGGALAAARSGAPRRPQRRRPGLLPRTADAAPARGRPRGGDRPAAALGRRAGAPDRRRDVPARRGGRGPPAGREQALDRQGRARPVRALVTGGAAGLGRRWSRGSQAEGFDGRRPRPDDRLRRHRPGPVGCGRARSMSPASTRASSAARPTRPRSRSRRYRRAMAVNVDGVVLGVRRLAQVMPAGGRIVATASLAGLTAMPDDPVYAATKHAVVGFVRSVAPSLERRGIQINAVCPGIADTAMLGGAVRERLDAAGFPLVLAAAVADAVWLALGSGLTGHAWAVQPGRDPVDFHFPNVPGAKTAEGVVVPPPSLAQ